MHTKRKRAVPTLLGAFAWILCAQYFVTQIIAAAAWAGGYSWANHLISDLGNTVCGQYTGRYVCSPRYALMNVSFIVLGITMVLGSALLYQKFKQSLAALTGFGLMALAGVGTIAVGLFPENVNIGLHSTGAFFALVVGNISLVVLAFGLRRVRRGFRIYTFASGIFSLCAFVLFQSGINLGLGQGGMERLVSYPLNSWLILFGLYMCGRSMRLFKRHSNRV